MKCEHLLVSPSNGTTNYCRKLLVYLAPDEVQYCDPDYCEEFESKPERCGAPEENPRFYDVERFEMDL